ncbi:hypothetical protein WA171_000836 [Blastocystis sp. BT1]
MAAVDGWVNDVDDVLSKAEHSYRQITDDTTTDEKRMLLADAKRLLNEAKDNLDALSIQIKKLPREQQINYINKKTAFSERIKVLQSDLKFQFQSMERKDLLGGPKDDGVEGGDMLIQHALQTQGKTIDAAKNTMMLLQETKQVALATTETLSQQTDQLGGMKGNVEDIDNQLKKSEQLIRAYLVRLMTDKIIMGLITLLVILIVAAVVIYYVYTKNRKPTEAPTKTPPFKMVTQMISSMYLRK